MAAFRSLSSANWSAERQASNLSCWTSYLLIVVGLLLAAVSGYSVATGKLLTLSIILAVVAVTFAVRIAHRFGMIAILYMLTAIYWLPVRTELLRFSTLFRETSLTEIGIWGLFIAIVLQQAVGRSNVGTVSRATREVKLACILVLCGLILSALASRVSQVFLAQVRVSIFYPLMMYVVYVHSLRTYEQVQRAMLVLVGTTGLLCLFLLALWFGGYADFSTDSIGGSRVGVIVEFPLLRETSIFEPASLAVHLAIIFCSGLGLIFGARSLFMRLSLVTCLITIGTMIILTQGRGGWLAVLAGVLVIVALNVRYMSLVKSLISISAFIMGILLVAATISYAFAANETLRERVLVLLNDPLADPNLRGRLTQYNGVWSFFLTHPVGTTLALTEPTYYIHSTYFTVLFATGVIGLAGVLLFIWSLVSQQISMIRSIDGASLQYRLGTAGLGAALAWIVGSASIPVGIYYTWEVEMAWISLSIFAAALTVARVNQLGEEK